jgi:hypothetical protein
MERLATISASSQIENYILFKEMEPFGIDTSFDKKSFIRMSMIRWKIQWMKFRKQIR